MIVLGLAIGNLAWEKRESTSTSFRVELFVVFAFRLVKPFMRREAYAPLPEAGSHGPPPHG